MKRILLTIISLFAFVVVPLTPVAAQIDVFPQCPEVPGSAICAARSNKLFGPGSLWNNILNIFTVIIGSVSVLMIVIGGFRYVISQGDQSAIKGAKDTILYAIIGLVVALLANAIVNLVLANI